MVAFFLTFVTHIDAIRNINVFVCIINRTRYDIPDSVGALASYIFNLLGLVSVRAPLRFVFRYGSIGLRL